MKGHYLHLTTHFHIFSPCVFSSFLSGNDSVVAPSADSHTHPLQNRALQVSIPHQGQHSTGPCAYCLIGMTVCHDEYALSFSWLPVYRANRPW